MKKKFKLLLSILFIFILTACSKTRPEELNELILTPESSNPVLEGTWQVTKIEEIAKSNNVYTSPGDKLYINKNLVAFKDEYAFPPSFTSKYVNLYDYFKNRGYELDKINKKDNAIIVNASQGQYFSRDFIQRSEDEMFFIADDKIIYLSRLSKKVDPKIVDQYTRLATKERAQPDDEKSITEDTSVLIGVRERTDLANNQQNYNYYTYLIRIRDDGKISYKKTPDIFLRGQDEYWKVRSFKNKLTGLYDNVEAFPVRIEDDMNQQSNKERYSFVAFDMDMKINYVDIDYISFSYLSSLSENTISKYGVLLTKELEDNSLVTIDEFTGENDAYDQLKSMVSNEATSKDTNIDPEDLIIEDDNFGIVRDIGSWVIQTSIYTKDSQQRASSQIPIRNYIEEKLTKTSDISLDQVRNINSQAKDYFIFSNGNYIIIQTADEILVYEIEDNEIENQPVFSIANSNPTAIISFDEQSGSNAKLLENAFENLNTIIDSN